FISGDKYKITTVPKWKYKGATPSQTSGNGQAGFSTVTYDAPGIYTATLTLENGWGSSSKTINYIEIAKTGIEDVTIEEMNAYPNPFENDVYVRFAEEGVYTVEIFDNAGRQLNRSSVNATVGEMVNIPVDGGSGIYFIKVRSNDTLLKVMKVIKK
ncbi:MAG: T9SS type A sorting domain-containing protein, partial [Bacteroidales bacterium]